MFKIFYYDNNNGESSYIESEFDEYKRAEISILSAYEFEFISIDDMKTIEDIIKSICSGKGINDIIFIDYNIENIKDLEKKKALLGDDLLARIKDINPFIQAYILTSDLSFVDGKNYKFAYHRDKFKKALDDAIDNVRRQNEMLDRLKDILPLLKEKTQDKISYGAYEVENIIDFLSYDSNRRCEIDDVIQEIEETLEIIEGQMDEE